MIRSIQPNETAVASSATAASNGVAKPPRKPKGSHGVQGGSSDANRLAVVILEVLAGVKTPTQAAAELAVSLPRYYQLETRALEGLVAALEPRPKGKQPLPANQIAALERQLEAAQRACARQQALARVAQRTLAVKLTPRPKVKPASGPTADGKTVEGKSAESKSAVPHDGAGRRRRRPAVRALKAVQALRKNVRPAESEAVQQPAPTDTQAAAAAAPPREPQREPSPLGV